MEYEALHTKTCLTVDADYAPISPKSQPQLKLDMIRGN